jgi:hypothetical protein
MTARKLGWGIVLVAALAGTAWLLRGEKPASRSAARPPAQAMPPPELPESAPDKPPPVAPDAMADDLAALVREGDAVAAATRLRARLRTDADARGRAERMLLDPATPEGLRIALAVVLGTIGESDPVLLAALERFQDDDAFARAVVLALGATRDPPDDDEIFDLGDRPWGVHVGKLGITVRRAIEDAATRAAIAARLAGAEPQVRLAAAQALRHSLANADTRDAFLANLDREQDDDVAGETGEAIAVWAATASGGTLDDALHRLLARAGDDDFDGYRFRLEDDLARVPLDADERASLVEDARASHPLSVRTFALEVLAGGAERSDAVAPARALLEGLAGADPDRAVRDTATRLLSRLPYEETTATLLTRLAKGDPEWSIRFTALETLASFGAKPGVLDALAAASGDADERVAQRARELREQLSK